MIYGDILLAYLLGSVPFGLLIARTKGIDLRKFGSGNIGATNAMRALGKPLGLLVLALDALKGFLPTWRALGEGAPPGPRTALICGVAAVLGHTFPVWLGFKGGKGVATGGGVWLALAPLPCAAAVATFGLVLAATRTVALASVMAALSMPVAMKALGTRPEWLLAWALGMACLIAFRHRGNFVRMAAGVEPRAGEARP